MRAPIDCMNSALDEGVLSQQPIFFIIPLDMWKLGLATNNAQLYFVSVIIDYQALHSGVCLDYANWN